MMKLSNFTWAVAFAASALGGGAANAVTLGAGDSFAWVGAGNFSYLSARIDVTVDSVLNGVFDLTVKVANLTDPTVNNNVSGNRLSVFGFDTDPSFTSATIDQNWRLSTGTMGISAGLDGCFEQGLTGNNNCNNGVGGIFAGNHLLFDIKLTTNNESATDIEFDRVWVRYQSVGEGDITGRSDNFDLTPVPLPAAGWLLLAGVGGLAAMRRRKKAA